MKKLGGFEARAFLFGLILLVTLVGISRGSEGYAMIPWKLNYQGVLTDAGGGVLSGVYHMHFRLWNQVTGGTLFWEENHPAVPVQNGIFNVVLGETNPFDSGEDFRYYRWLEMQVENDAPMAPRRELLSQPYAFKAGLCGVQYQIGVNGGTVEISIPCYTSFQISASELHGSSDSSAWMSGGANDQTLSYVGINADGTVAHGTCSLSSPCTILTIRPGLVLRTKGDSSYTLVLDSSGFNGESRAIFYGNHTVPQGGPY